MYKQVPAKTDPARGCWRRQAKLQQVAQHRARRRSNRGKRFGSDGGSESDEDEGRPRRTDGDDSQTTAKQKGPQQIELENSDANPAISGSLLEQEEVERLSLFRTLQQVGERTEKIRQHRYKCRKRSMWEKKKIMARHHRYKDETDGKLERTSPSREAVDRVAKENRLLQEYLDDTLYGDIVDRLDGDGESANEFGQDELVDLERMMEDVQLEFLEQCRDFDISKDDSPRHSTTRLRIISMVESVERGLWEYIDKRDMSDERDTEDLVKAFMTDTCLYGAKSVPLSIAPILQELNHKVIQQMASCIDTRESMKRAVERLGYEASCLPKASLFSKLESFSRAEYTNWILGNMDWANIRDCLSMWHRERRADTVREFRREMDSIHLSVEQEFITGIVKSSGVSLVLFKGGHPATIKHVSDPDLKRMGWVEESAPGLEHTYWRYEIEKGLVFRVASSPFTDSLTVSGKIVPLTIIKGAGHERIEIPQGECAVIADFHSIQTKTSGSPTHFTTGFYRVVPGPTRYGDYDYEETKYVLSGQIDVTDEATGITHHLVPGDWAFFHVGSKAQFSTRTEGVAFYAVTRPMNNTPHVNLKGPAAFFFSKPQILSSTNLLACLKSLAAGQLLAMGYLEGGSVLYNASIGCTILLTFAATLVFVPKNAILTRVGVTVALSCIQYTFYTSVLQTSWTAAQISDICLLSWGFYVNGTEQILLSRYDIDDVRTRAEREAGHRLGPVTLLSRAAGMYFNLRRVGLRGEVPVKHRNSPQRGQLLLAKTVETIALYLIMDAAMSAPLPEGHLITRDKQTLIRLSNLSWQDAAFRVVSTIGYWFISYVCNRLNHACAAVLTLSLGLSKPEDWPHLNGPLSACYTVRSFWG
ncbi:hypothetical protein F66182_1088 [Fusarium sp. NRRL 66182]|nr:hypothetical protein F66182_1088 [Fusarium sp. NRRL 66182]